MLKFEWTEICCTILAKVKRKLIVAALPKLMLIKIGRNVVHEFYQYQYWQPRDYQLFLHITAHP